MITVRMPGGSLLSVDDPVDTLQDLLDVVTPRVPPVAGAHSFNVNGALIVNGERFVALSDGDEVEILGV